MAGWWVLRGRSGVTLDLAAGAIIKGSAGLADCRRVSVLDCDIDSADDSICLKSDPRGEGCADSTIDRCILASRVSALKFGTASHHGFKRIRASDLTVNDTYRSVVALQAVDGAAIEDVVVERVKATQRPSAQGIPVQAERLTNGVLSKGTTQRKRNAKSDSTIQPRQFLAPASAIARCSAAARAKTSSTVHRLDVSSRR